MVETCVDSAYRRYLEARILAQGLVEYAIIVAVIAVIALVAVQGFGTGVAGLFEKLKQHVESLS